MQMLNNAESNYLVLLSTYNGMDFLPEFLASIPITKNIALLARDDGSTDETLNFLIESSRKRNMKIIKGENIGSDASFHYLLKNCSMEYDYYFLADQDDIWDLNKIIFQSNELGKNNALISFSNYETYFKGRVIRASKLPSPNIRHQLVENRYLGATTCFSKEFLDAYRKQVDSFYGHIDALLALLGSISNKSILVDKPLIKYRIHEQQQIGLGKGRSFSFRVSQSINMTSDQIKNGMKFASFLRITPHSFITKNCRYLREPMLFRRFIYLFKVYNFRSRLSTQLIFAIAYLLGKFVNIDQKNLPE